MEWFYYDKSDKTHLGCILPCGLIIIIAVIMAFYQFTPPKEPQIQNDEKVDESLIAIRINTDSLKQAFYDRAGEWFEVGTSFRFSTQNPFSFSVKTKEGVTAKEKFEQIFLSPDSAAAKISRDYPELFQFEEHDNGICEFSMKKTTSKLTGYTIVPTYLIVNLIKENILILSTDSNNNN